MKLENHYLSVPSSLQSSTNGTAAVSESSDFSEDHDSPKQTKPFFRRLSVLRKGKVSSKNAETHHHCKNAKKINTNCLPFASLRFHFRQYFKNIHRTISKSPTAKRSWRKSSSSAARRASSTTFHPNSSRTTKRTWQISSGKSVN